MERNYATEMRALIDEATAHGPYTTREVAEKVVQHLIETNPDLLYGWLNAQAIHFIQQMINDRDRSLRSRARAVNSRSVFARSAERFESGDDSAMITWLHIPYSLEGGIRKALADLTADDLKYVASDYSRRASENAFEAMFFQALADKVGNGTVADRFTDEQLVAMRESLHI